MRKTNLVGFPFLDGFKSADPVLHFLTALGAQHEFAEWSYYLKNKENI